MYFEKKRSLATGIAVCGSGFGKLRKDSKFNSKYTNESEIQILNLNLILINRNILLGTLIFAPITNNLIKKFEWQGALLIIGFIVYGCSIFGAMFKPLKPVPVEKTNETDEKYEPLLSKNKNEKYQVSDLQFNSDNNDNGQIQRSKSIGWDFRKSGKAKVDVKLFYCKSSSY